MPLYDDPPNGLRMAAEPLERWTEALLERLGTPPDVAADVAEILLASDLRGIASHGTARLPQYVALAEAGTMDPAARPVKERGRPALALFDARNGWGHHAGRVAMDDAIERALTLGTAISVVRNSNHYGIAGWYAMRAAEGGLIGVSLTNTSPLVAPTRARIPMLGHEPDRARGAGRPVRHPVPGHGHEHDPARPDRGRGATRRGAAAAVGDRAGRLARRRRPTKALAGALQPLGGTEETAGYKGYGLALIVEVLTGILAGAAFGPEHRRPVLDRGEERPRPVVPRHRSGRDRRTGRVRGAPGTAARAAHGGAAHPERARPGAVARASRRQSARNDRGARASSSTASTTRTCWRSPAGWTCRCRTRSPGRAPRPPAPAAAGQSVGRA